MSGIFFLFLIICDVKAELPGKLGEIEKKLPEIKVQETVISVSPKMRFYLPSGALDLNLRQEYKKTSIEFSSKYDFINNFMAFSLDNFYNILPLPFGVTLSDRVNFKERLSDKEYIQRSQFISPYIQYSINKTAKIKNSFKIENTYTDSVAALERIDQGRNIIDEIKIWDNTIEEIASLPAGSAESLSIEHSFKNLGSDYDYTQAELNFRKFIYPFKNHYHFLEYVLQAGYPIAVEARPLTSYYTAGGYRLLKGYNYQEFRGDAIIYNSFKYTFPLTKIKNGKKHNDETHLSNLLFNIVTWDFFAEAVKIGDKNIYSQAEDIKCSLGTGIAYRIVIFKQFPVEIELSTAKAFDNRNPQFYLTVSTIYYTWKN